MMSLTTLVTLTPTLVVYLIAAYLTLQLVLPLFLRLFVLPHHLRIGRFSFSSVSGISWEKDGVTARVEKVRCVRWRGRRAGQGVVGETQTDRDKDRAWFVIRCEGVTVDVKKDALVLPREKRDPPPPPGDSPRPPPPPPPHPSRFSALLSRLSSLLVLFALHIDITSLTLEDTLVLSGTLCIGGEIALRSAGAEQVKAWVRLSKVRFAEVATKEEGMGKQPCPALEMRAPLVVRVEAPLQHLRASAHQREGWAPKERGVKLQVLFGGAEPAQEDAQARERTRRGSTSGGLAGRIRKASMQTRRAAREGEEAEQTGGVHVRVHELKRVLDTVSELAAQRKAAKPSAPRQPEPTLQQPPKRLDECTPPRPPPLAYLDSLLLSVPAFVISAHYTTPPHVLSAPSTSSAAPLPKTIAFALSVHDVRADVKLGGLSDEVRGGHREWIGRGEEVAWIVGAEWREVEGRIKMDGSEEEVLLDASKALSFGPSRLDVTSTWHPPFLSRSTCPPTDCAPRPCCLHIPQNHNDAVVVLEAFLGEVRGHAPFETIDSALRIIKARPRKATPSRPSSPTTWAGFEAHQQDETEKKARLVHGLPRIVGTAMMGGVELRIQAPRTSHAADRDPLDSPTLNGDPTDPFFRNWSAPELLCLSFPNGQVSFGGEYVDRSVRRSESDRRAARRAAKHRRQESRNSSKSRRSAQDGDEDEERRVREGDDRGRSTSRGRHEERPTRTFEEEFGVPPPPPLTQEYHKRKLKPLKAIPNLTKDQDRFGLEYRTRFSLSTDILNVYILASSSDSLTHENGYSSDSSAGNGGWTKRDARLPMLPSDPVRLDILAFGPLEWNSAVTLLGDETTRARADAPLPFVDLSTCRGEHGILLETIEVDLWRPIVMGCLRDLITMFATASATSTKQKKEAERTDSARDGPSPIVDILPSDQNLYIALASFDLRIAGTDPKADAHSCRGIALHSGPVVLQYLLQSEHEPGLVGNFAERSALELTEDIRLEANACANPAPKALGGSDLPSRIALAKFSILDLSVDPVVDARASRGRKRYAQARGDGHGEERDDGWEMRGRADLADLTGRRKSIVPPRFTPSATTTVEEKELGKGLIVLPHLAVRLRCQRAAPSDATATSPIDEFIVSFASETINLRLELFSIYLCLVAISSLRVLRPSVSPPTDASSSDIRDAPVTTKRHSPLIQLKGEIGDLHMFPTLPHDTHLFVNLRKINLRFDKTSGLAVNWEKAMLAGQSPTVPGKWEDIIRLRGSQFRLRPEPDNQGNHPFIISLSSETARLRIPFRYIFSRIVDNAASLVKATKQLVYEHVKGGHGFIIEPHPEGPKRLPQIELRVGLFAVEMQDDPFETKLNIIWRAGSDEQNSRLERQAAFDAKVEAIRRAEADGGNDEDEGPDTEDSGTRFASRAKSKVNARHTIGIDEAQRDLLAYNSSHWVRRIRNAAAEQARREETLARRLYGPKDRSSRATANLPIDLVAVSRSAPLARATFHGLSFVITKPSFGEDGLHDFLHDVGKGLPRDTRFTLLVPLHFSWTMEEARFQIRDYPLPLLHVPRSGRRDVPSWQCESDLVIAEEVSGPEAVRRVPCAVIPAHVFQGMGAPYTIVVPRSAMPVKTYAMPVVKIHASEPTRIGWGNSIQPAIQDVARVVDTLSKASPDPSERIGFWDKIRLQVHWRVQLLFPGKAAAVLFHLKGSRDPYALTGFGAGFAKAWKGDVQFRIGLDNPDREFFQILSDEYVLGIPNLREYVDTAATGLSTRDSDGETPADGSTYAPSTVGGDEYDTASTVTADEDEASYWIKICAKCVNGVRWGMGVVLERSCRDKGCEKAGCCGLAPFHRQCRMFDFRPHWEVHTKTSAAIGLDGEVDDSFAGFRSDFVHFSLSLTSPANLSLPNLKNSTSSAGSVDYSGEHGYNSFHFTPNAMTHFIRWWKLFDSSMSLPIRQGKLFPSAQAPSPKFGRHTATIKYRFSLAPLFISHTYRQDNWQDWARGETTVLGIKAKIGRFNVDLHQRAQEMVIRRPEMSETKTVTHKVFYMAEVDLDSLDLRTITAIFREPEKAELAPPDIDPEDDVSPAPTYDDFVLSEDDHDWVNLNDYHDSIYTMPVEEEPRMRIMPFIVSPRFTYYRHKDATMSKDWPEENGSSNGTSGSPAEKPKTKFGDEKSHTCLMGCATDTITVQIKEAQMRLVELEGQLADTDDDDLSAELELRIRAVHRIIERLAQVRVNAHPDFDSSSARNQHGRGPPTPATPTSVEEDSADAGALPHLTNSLYEEWGQWENRYMIHNPTCQVSNATRDLLLKYYYSSRDRKGFVYYASASVLRFIRDLAEKHEKKHRRDWSRRKSTRTGGSSQKRSGAWHDSEQANKLLEELSKREGDFWATNEEQDEGRHHFGDHLETDPYLAAAALPDVFDANSGHLCMFIKPQVSLQSDVDDKSTLIFTAFRAQVKVFQIVDSRIPEDPVNSEVLHQTFARLDGMQIFYPRQQLPRRDRRLLQAFVPLETLIDLRVEPRGFDRVVARTSAALRYDKFNQLRLSSKRDFDDGGLGPGSSQLESHFHTSTDRISFEADKFTLSANPAHFAAVYNVVTNLVLYSDPARKSRSRDIEALVFTRDFSNLRTLIDTVSSLQQRLRRFGSLGQEYQIHLDELDDEGRLELFMSRAELFKAANELNLVVEAFTRAQDSNGPKTTSKRAGLQLEAHAAELTWHMLDKGDLPLAKFSVIGAEFSWASKQDGSASNRMVIKDLRALNSSPEQVFAEIVAKVEGCSDENQLAKVDIFAAALWNTHAPVGGIAIIERFELHLHPIKLQLEHRVGRKILDYLFAERQQKTGDGGDDTPSSRNGSRLSLPASNSSASRSAESLALPRPSQSSSTANLPLTSSSGSIRSVETRVRKAISTEALINEDREEGLDADEMRRRAATNRTFIFVEVSSTVLCLTYRSEKEDKSSLPNIYNITYTTPLIQYRSKTWSFLDMLNEIKRDMIRSVWQQKGQLIGQLLSKTHRRLPMAEARSAAKQAVQASIRNRMRLVKARASTFAANNSSVPLHERSPPLRHDDPLLGTPAVRDPASASSSSSRFPTVTARDSSSSSSDDEEDNIADSSLPFDVAATELIDPNVEFADDGEYPQAIAQARAARDESGGRYGVIGPLVEEPESFDEEEVGGAGEGVVRDSTQSSGDLSAISFPTTESPSSRSDSSPYMSLGSTRKRPSSMTQPARSMSTSSRQSIGYPHHNPLRKQTVEMDDDEKARMLLGRSLD
ncbi:RHTO0S12e05996g1_1 [Rhodotorula toruloides]|uniref:RHTO0S12e05996g1_1 n=1 Tax=Rhodotorula toruloides TaxID=5286 RepID=A0A061BB46_RHOTO|nr:RHTO0S12e05996g1_1 [Rhodotorula toruloides]